MAVIAFLRWRTFEAVPSGTDPGNWLAYGHAILGEQIRSPSIVYPPLVPLLTVGITKAFGLTIGLRLLAVVCAAFPAIALYVVLRSMVGAWWSSACAMLLAVAGSIGEAAAWGGYPQLLALGFLVLFAVRLDVFLTTARLRDAVMAAALLAAALASNDLVGGATVGVGVVVVGLHAATAKRDTTALRRRLPGLAVIAVPALAFIPLYATMLRQLLASEARSSGFSWQTLTRWLDVVYSEWPGLWRVLFVLGFAAPVAFVAQRRSVIWRLLVAVDVVSAVALLTLHIFRFVYLLPIAGVIGVATLADVTRGSHRDVWRWAGQALALTMAGAVAIEFLAVTQEFPEQVHFYTVLTPTTVVALDWIRDHAPPRAVVAVSPAGPDFPLGWWVEGFARRPAIYGADPALLIYTDELRRAAEAAPLFRIGEGVDRALQRARAIGAAYLLVDKRWAGYADWARSDPPQPHGRGVIIDDSSVVLVSTTG